MARRKPRAWYVVLLSKTNVIVTIGTASFILYTRSVHAAYFGAGTLACALSAKLIKRLLRQPRPRNDLQHKLTYGMPSTHTSAMAFQATYLTLSALFLSFAPLTGGTDPPAWVRIVLPALFVPYAAAIAWSRIALGHHTWLQVAGGVVWGVTFACCWWRAWGGGVREAVGRPVVSALGGWVTM